MVKGDCLPAWSTETHGRGQGCTESPSEAPQKTNELACPL